MFLKLGVVTSGVSHYIWFALGSADSISRAEGAGPITVTSLRDGKHKSGSLHYKGLAADIRTRHMTAEQCRAVHGKMREWLDPLGYDTVLESDHIHCEYDPKPGEEAEVRVD